jgi:hypothetical protein
MCEQPYHLDTSFECVAIQIHAKKTAEWPPNGSLIQINNPSTKRW